MCIEQHQQLGIATELKNEYGFDIFHSFDPQWYNDLLLQEDNGINLPLLLMAPTTTTGTPTRSYCNNSCSSEVQITQTTIADNYCTENYHAFLIGNTKYLWNFFVRWYKNKNLHPTLINPLDTYVQESIESVVQKWFGTSSRCDQPNSTRTEEEKDAGTSWRLYWSATMDNTNNDMVSMQRIAMISGFSYYDIEHTKLSIHPVYGAWHSFRAVLLIKKIQNKSIDCSCTINGTDKCNVRCTKTAPTVLSCFLSENERQHALNAWKYAISRNNHSFNDSITGTRPNINLEHHSNNEDNIFHSDDHVKKTTTNATSATTEAWIAVRDSISIGKELYKFGSNQIMYHYTWNPIYIQFD